MFRDLVRQEPWGSDSLPEADGNSEADGNQMIDGQAVTPCRDPSEVFKAAEHAPLASARTGVQFYTVAAASVGHYGNCVIIGSAPVQP